MGKEEGRKDESFFPLLSIEGKGRGKEESQIPFWDRYSSEKEKRRKTPDDGGKKIESILVTEEKERREGEKKGGIAFTHLTLLQNYLRKEKKKEG